jgi:ribosomal protein L11 methyltransferase
MELLELVATYLPQGKFTALDVGTGSGILAIALTKLGAKRVWAIDNDPVALEVARENLQINGATANIHLSGTRLSNIRRRFPVVVANLTAETILGLADAMEKLVAPRGFLILSGILKYKANSIVRRFAARFQMIKRKGSREWITFLLRRK